MQPLLSFVNVLSAPQYSFTLLSCLMLLLFPPSESLYRIHVRYKLNFLWTRRGGLYLMATFLGLLGMSLTNDHFRSVALLPDNVPSLFLLILVTFFAWFSMYQAWENDRRLERKEPTKEKQDSERILVWPDLVFIEFIAALFMLALLILWSLSLQAPLEGVADPANSPNPAKAPWYFLALQEMLVYFDPWFAGVIIPTLLLVILILFPYVDPDRKHTGFYSYRPRKFFMSSFICFFICVWVYLQFVGNVMRGPNWNFFGPFEPWDSHKVVAITNINLSEYLYMVFLKRPLPENIFLREIGGFIFLGTYFVVALQILKRTWLKFLYEQVPRASFYVFSTVYILLWLLPVKMYLRWIFNLKYIISIPELLLNI